MTCPKCGQLSFAKHMGEFYCLRCDYSPKHPELPLRATHSEENAGKGKKPTEAQKAVQKAENEDSAVLFRKAWEQLSRRDPSIPLVAEYEFHHLRGWRFDFAFIPWMLAIEIDGGQWMPGGGRHGGDGDREKMNAAAALGWRVMHFSPKQLRDNPLKCVRLVESALGRREEMETG